MVTLARPIDEGYYLIVNAKNPSVAMDVNGAGLVDGSNVQVWTILNNRAQLFFIKYNEDDSCRIVAAYTGKCVDVNGQQFVDGTNVQQYTDNGTRAQQWILDPTGETITFREIEYPTFRIKIAANTNFALDVSGTTASAGSNCMLWTDYGSSSGLDRNWFFVPRPKLSSGGVYELHPLSDLSKAMDITSWSKANGAQVITWDSHHGNNQKFVLLEESSDHWRVRNVHSGKYLDITGNVAKEGAKIVQWGEPVSVIHQQFKILVRDTHTHAYLGEECAVVSLGAYGTNSDGNMFTVRATSRDVDISADVGGNTQRWLLYPTSATDPNIPIPYVAGVSYAVGKVFPNGGSTVYQRDELYPVWSCTKSWTQSGPNHYEWRMRKRYMRSSNSTWADWSDWTAWETAVTHYDETQAWLVTPIDGSYSIDDYKNLQFEIQVRCVGIDETENLVGEPGTCDAYCVWLPTFEFSSAGVSADGIRVEYSNDYQYGMCTLHIHGVSCESVLGGNNLLMSEQTYGSLDYEGSFLIPSDALITQVPDGASVTLWYTVDTDQSIFLRETPYNWSDEASNYLQGTVTVLEDAGNGADAEPRLVKGIARTLLAYVTHIGTERMWVRYSDGTSREVEGNVFPPGNTVFDIEYPFGVDFDLFTSVISDDGELWGTNSTHISATDPLVGPPCHAWHWDDGYLLLECDTEPLKTDRMLRPVYESKTLDSRKRNAVTFAPTIGSTLKATGYLVDGQTQCTLDHALALVEANHAFYRSPTGETMDVAITELSYQQYDGYISVEIGMIEETV